MFSIFVQANFAGLASLLPNTIMHIMVTGQAVSGMFAVFAQIIILLGNLSVIQSTFIYFTFACVVILFTLIIYLIANKTVSFLFILPIFHFNNFSIFVHTEILSIL